MADFNPRRFLPGTKACRRDVWFRAFGGGKILCPGRHFATNEVLAVVAMFVARFDMTPVGAAGGEWKYPTSKNTNVAAVVMQPDEDIEVEIKTREDFENSQIEWAITLDGTGKTFALVTEDGVMAE